MALKTRRVKAAQYVVGTSFRSTQRTRNAGAGPMSITSMLKLARLCTFTKGRNERHPIRLHALVGQPPVAAIKTGKDAGMTDFDAITAASCIDALAAICQQAPEGYAAEVAQATAVLRDMVADADQTIQELGRAVREAAEPPMFMGEPIAVATVPRDPTWSMCEAGRKASGVEFALPEDIWRAMFDAARRGSSGIAGVQPCAKCNGTGWLCHGTDDQAPCVACATDGVPGAGKTTDGGM